MTRHEEGPSSCDGCYAILYHSVDVSECFPQAKTAHRDTSDILKVKLVGGRRGH